MYNGIGITTPRGTGTNGYVQRNLSFVPTKRERVEYVKDVELKKLETLIEKKGNAEILEHEKKRKIEVKCMEMRDMMLNNGYDEETTTKKVQIFRKTLIEREGLYEKSEIDYDEDGRPVAKETHQLAQANDEKNRRLREAFGIGEFNQKDIQKRKAEEAKEIEKQKADLAKRQYTIVADEPEEAPSVPVPPSTPKESEKKRRKSSPSDTKSRKHSKKHRRHRDRSSDH